MNKASFYSVHSGPLIPPSLWLWLVAVVLLVFGLIIFDAWEDSQTYYKMPNGIICKISYTTGGGFGGATHEFKSCSDGKIYVNPETYRRFKK